MTTTPEHPPLVAPEDVPDDLVLMAHDNTGGCFPDHLLRLALAAVIPTLGVRALESATWDQYEAMVRQIAEDIFHRRAADVHGSVRRVIATALEEWCIQSCHCRYIHASFCLNCEQLAYALRLPVDAPAVPITPDPAAGG